MTEQIVYKVDGTANSKMDDGIRRIERYVIDNVEQDYESDTSSEARKNKVLAKARLGRNGNEGGFQFAGGCIKVHILVYHGPTSFASTFELCQML